MGKLNVFAGLTPAFRARMENLLLLCEDAGFRAVPYTGYRDPAEQAELWAQSRTEEERNAAVTKLRRSGALFLADLLARADPAVGPRVTNALPGQSWHQFRQAVDCFIESPESGRALWRNRNMDGTEFGLAAQLYARFGSLVESGGLTWGGSWAIGDYGHVQLDQAASPLAAFRSWSELSRVVELQLTRSAPPD